MDTILDSTHIRQSLMIQNLVWQAIQIKHILLPYTH